MARYHTAVLSDDARPRRKGRTAVVIADDELRRLYCEHGLSAERIASLLGCSASYVRTRLVAAGIERRTPWAQHAVACSIDDLRRLYLDEQRSLSEIAERYGCSPTTIWRKLKAAGIEARPDGSRQQYERRDFSGDPVEKAYLIGLRLGDLNVGLEGNSVVVKCTSTRPEQLALFREVFGKYGHVYSDEATQERRKRRSMGMQASLNRTFDFLLPKGDCIPDWIRAQEDLFFAFFAGYVDAEGSIQVARRQPNQARIDVKTYDHTILRQSWEALTAAGIACPEPVCDVAAGYPNSRGVTSRRACWRLGAYSKASLRAIFSRIHPHLRHGKRRHDLETALAALELPRRHFS